VINNGKTCKISWSEFKAFVGVLGVSVDDAKVACEPIDINNNRVLSKDQLCIVCACHYFDVDNTLYKHFLWQIQPYLAAQTVAFCYFDFHVVVKQDTRYSVHGNLGLPAVMLMYDLLWTTLHCN